jgi:hypothetical protein
MWLRLFEPYSGDLIGLPTSENHLVFRWAEPGCKVLFSITQHGKSASCHFASDKRGLRHLKRAFNEFCEFVFDQYEWCKMIIAKIDRKSVCKLVEKCGFALVLERSNKYIYVRVRSWDL